jgi:acyl dehydratase
LALYFDDLRVGMRLETQARTVTEADIVHFAGISGDFNPLHTDATFAAATPFGQRIAHGLLVLSMVTGLHSREGWFDGSTLAFLEISGWRFLKPVFPGDTVRAALEILELRPTSKPDRGVVRYRNQVYNQRGELVQEGDFVLLLRRRHDAEEAQGLGN